MRPIYFDLSIKTLDGEGGGDTEFLSIVETYKTEKIFDTILFLRSSFSSL